MPVLLMCWECHSRYCFLATGSAGPDCASNYNEVIGGLGVRVRVRVTRVPLAMATTTKNLY